MMEYDFNWCEKEIGIEMMCVGVGVMVLVVLVVVFEVSFVAASLNFLEVSYSTSKKFLLLLCEKVVVKVKKEDLWLFFVVDCRDEVCDEV